MRLGLIVLAAAMLLPFGMEAQSPLPWWQRETQLSPEGRLVLTGKPWWPHAQQLKEGEEFTLDLNGNGHAETTVRRVDGDIVEAIDDTDRATAIFNHESTTYVVSYGGSGVVDRMVSYLPNGHGGAREVELRYFRDGYLRYAWFAESHGGDAADIFALKHWQYAGNDQGSHFRGNAQIYINKYDPLHKSWQPLSECPFSFWDTDHDGRTDVTLRVSAAPLGTLHGPDTDYANNYDYMWAKEAVPAERIGALNMRLSMNLDGSLRTDPLDKPHSTFSFTMVGAQPYRYAGMRDFDAHRRLPQTTIHMPWAAQWKAAQSYPATEVGLSWDEARDVFRWEGQFWIYERRYLSNTGSPTRRWNMRREFSDRPGAERALYYSAADKRYHLAGAREGWLEVNSPGSDTKVLEYRWWDSNADGVLDTVEVFRGTDTQPARVATFLPAARRVALLRYSLAAEYTVKVIPSAIADDEALIRLLDERVADPAAAQFKAAAAAANSAEQRRYFLDNARELLFLALRDKVHSMEQALPYAAGRVDAKHFRDPGAGDAKDGYTLGDSLKAWSLARGLQALDQAYANGDTSKFTKAFRAMPWDGQ